jgi:hypothetical protein
MQLATALKAADSISNVATLLLVVAIVVALFFVIRYAYNLYQNFTDLYHNVTDLSIGSTEADVANTFTPHQSDGSVFSKDVAPKGTDPIDWLFMAHDDPT